MNQNNNQTGYFVFSLDTELGTGYFDLDKERTKIFSRDGKRERKSIQRILELCNYYGITATWAVVGHIMYAQCEKCEVCPIMEWKDKYKSYDEAYGTSHPLWYGADVIDLLLASERQHEIAFHGYTHEVFDESLMTPERASFEINEWVRLAKRWNITPKSVVFPRDNVGHLSAFHEAGFICYRSEKHDSLLIRNKYFGKYIKTMDHLLNLTTPPVYALDEIEYNGMVNMKESQHIFGFNRKIELFLDSLNLHKLRIRRIIKGINKAAAEKKVIHVWAHPWEFRTDKDFEKLAYIFEAVSDQIGKGNFHSTSMGDLAQITITQHNVKQRIVQAQ